MYSHMMVGSNDVERSKRFYDALFAAIGGRPGRIDDRGRVTWVHRGNVFMVTKPIDGEPATPSNGSTIGFAMETPEQADAWHKAGVENGGTSVENPPGERPGSGFYLAYLRDPDGHKLCALHRIPT
jgi:catechol 2,3-dioxygenase-like lactoylglutathione lyase family enzyme